MKTKVNSKPKEPILRFRNGQDVISCLKAMETKTTSGMHDRLKIKKFNALTLLDVIFYPGKTNDGHTQSLEYMLFTARARFLEEVSGSDLASRFKEVNLSNGCFGTLRLGSRIYEMYETNVVGGCNIYFIAEYSPMVGTLALEWDK